jgi:hypothetical protein
VHGVVHELRTLHGLAGTLYDARVLKTGILRDPNRRFARASRQLRLRLAVSGARQYVTLERRWLNEAAIPFFGRVRRIAHRLDAMPAI